MKHPLKIPEIWADFPRKHMFKNLRKDVKQSLEEKAAYDKGENCITIQEKRS